MAANERNEKTCEQLIDSHLSSRLETIMPDFDDYESCYDFHHDYTGVEGGPEFLKECGLVWDHIKGEWEENVPDRSQDLEDYIWEHYQDDILQFIHEFHREKLMELPLCVDRRITYRIDLSTGGPADFIKLEWDPGCRQWVGGTYHYQDWFDGAVRTLSYEQADAIAEAFGIYVEE